MPIIIFCAPKITLYIQKLKLIDYRKHKVWTGEAAQGAKGTSPMA